jgi:hypothetical protein
MSGVTKEQCDDRHGRSAKVNSLIAVLSAAFVVLAGMAIADAGSASRRAAEVQRAFESHAAAQAAETRHVEQALRRIESRLESLRAAEKTAAGKVVASGNIH